MKLTPSGAAQGGRLGETQGRHLNPTTILGGISFKVIFILLGY
jgi:hypothetical protein